MQYLVLGLNHRTAPVAIRERLALDDGRLGTALGRLGGHDDIQEGVILSTCNRVEFYTASRQPTQAAHAAWTILEEVCGLGQNSHQTFQSHLYQLQGEQAVKHLFRVASSLDSMVVGEPQILGQLKSAYQKAVEAGVVGTFLDRSMSKAFSAAKRVKTETRIAESGVSVASVAAQLAEKIFGSLDGKSILLVGAGEMAELAAKHLAAQGAKRTTIANRSIERAEALAAALGGVARPLESLPELLISADIVITSTGAAQPILHRASLAGIMRARKYRPLFLIDIAVPRDVEPAAGELDNVYLYDVDDLEQVVAANMASRLKEAQAAEIIVQQEVAQFMAWIDESDVVPTLVAMRERAHLIKNTELERALAKMTHLNERDRKLIEQLAASLTNKMLHTPTVALKRRAAEGTATREVVALVHDLFDLPPDPQTPDPQTARPNPSELIT